MNSNKFEKGDRTALNVTQEAHHRIFVGLGWDPKDEENSGIIGAITDKISGKALHHDLDLSCYLYDANDGLISVVNAETEKGTDRSGKVYHSGDNVEGIGDGDDEQISVELKDIDPSIIHMIFTATIKSGHNFSDIDTPEIRLVDAYSDHTFAQKKIDQIEGQDKSGYVFLAVYYTPEGWHMHYIDEYFTFKKKGDLDLYLKKYLKSA